jgi:hypothetical protein
MRVEFRLVLKPHLVWKVARTVVKLFFLRLQRNIIRGAQKHSYVMLCYVLDSIHVLGMMKMNKNAGQVYQERGALWSVT